MQQEKPLSQSQTAYSQATLLCEYGDLAYAVPVGSRTVAAPSAKDLADVSCSYFVRLLQFCFDGVDTPYHPVSVGAVESWQQRCGLPLGRRLANDLKLLRWLVCCVHL
jgi:hypothetical protein